MAYNLKILPSAENDIDEATKCYSEILDSVFEHFNDRLDEAFLRIETNPFFQKRFKNIRALPLKKFPYIIFFEIFEEIKKVYIISVFCTHQNPEKYP